MRAAPCSWSRPGSPRAISLNGRDRNFYVYPDKSWPFGGVAGYLEVLDAQRSLFSAELDEVQTISNQLVSLIQLYKALGGGPRAARCSR